METEMATTATAYTFHLAARPEEVPASALGVEMTDAALADRCARGNLDPQHGPQAAVGALAAVEAALDFALPPRGTPLVTIRPDCDAVGAMAVLDWRARRRTVSRDMRRRISRIAQMDGFRRGPWIGPRPMPRSAEELHDEWPGADMLALSAMCFDRGLDMKSKVQAMTAWFARGTVPTAHADAKRAQDEALVTSLRDGSTRIDLTAGGRISQARSTHHAALQLAYRLSDVVVCTNERFAFPCGVRGAKHTVAKWDGTGMIPVARALSQLEAGWGGQPGIVGSPQFAPSVLSGDEVVRVVVAELGG
jgi:hypothetical protein